MKNDDNIRFYCGYWFPEKNKMGDLEFYFNCQKLTGGKPQKSRYQIEAIFQEKCKDLLKELSIKHRLSKSDILDIIVPRLIAFQLDVDTIESDEEKEVKMISQEKRNKAFFDRFSENE